MNVVDEIFIIYAGTKGFLDKVPIRQVSAWEEQFLRYMKEQRSDVRTALIKERKLTSEIEQRLRAAIDAFGPQFKATK
jgi:F-type H+-transporting ATPase subunit alpha